MKATLSAVSIRRIVGSALLCWGIISAILFQQGGPSPCFSTRIAILNRLGYLAVIAGVVVLLISKGSLKSNLLRVSLAFNLILLSSLLGLGYCLTREITVIQVNAHEREIRLKEGILARYKIMEPSEALNKLQTSINIDRMECNQIPVPSFRVDHVWLGLGYRLLRRKGELDLPQQQTQR
jgi:hypothetical protein